MDAKWCKERLPPPASLIPPSFANLWRAMHHHVPRVPPSVFYCCFICKLICGILYLNIFVSKNEEIWLFFSLVILHIFILPSPCSYFSTICHIWTVLRGLSDRISRKSHYSYLCLWVSFGKIRGNKAYIIQNWDTYTHWWHYQGYHAVMQRNRKPTPTKTSCPMTVNQFQQTYSH